jgi:hypothetical protein
LPWISGPSSSTWWQSRTARTGARPDGWFVAVSRGRFLHENIAALEPHRQENLIGWTGHYAVGILYGIVFAAIVGTGWQQAPTFLPAFVFGIVTVGAGWFIMQPGMGLGLAASKRQTPTRFAGSILQATRSLPLAFTARASHWRRKFACHGNEAAEVNCFSRYQIVP